MKRSKVYSRIEEIPEGKASDDIREGCLVIEGGAFRGLYNQGVLDALMLNDINFHTTIGVSAGALAGLNYVSGQIGRSARANLTYRHDSRYIGGRALKRSHSILNLNFLLKTYNQYEMLDWHTIREKKRRLIAVVTNCLTGKPKYYDSNQCDHMLDAIKASASMPYISKMVDVEGTPCLDGGCSCKIAYQWALDEGFDKIVVIRTREKSFRKPDKESRMAERVYRNYSAFARALNRSDKDYNAQCDELERLEAEGRLFIIAPSEPVSVGRLEKDVEKLGELYWLGYHDTLAALEALRNYLDQ